MRSLHRGRLMTKRTLRRYLTPVVFFFVAWEIISILTPDLFWPSLPTFLIQTFNILTGPDIYVHIAHTLGRTYLGWVFGATLGVLFGVSIGESEIVSDVLKPYVTLGRFIPAIAWIGVFIIWFGSGLPSILAMVIYSSTVLSMLNSLTGMIQAGRMKERIRAAQIMGASRWDIFLRVKIPTTMPAVWTGIRTALAVSFLQIVAAEMLVASTGLGYVIWISRSYFQITRMFVAIFILGLIGFVSDQLLDKAGQTYLKKYGV